LAHFAKCAGKNALLEIRNMDRRWYDCSHLALMSVFKHLWIGHKFGVKGVAELNELFLGASTFVKLNSFIRLAVASRVELECG